MTKKKSLRIKIEKDPYSFGTNLFQESSITLKPGLNVLVGCNGAGKSTMLKNIERYCEDKEIPCYMNDSRKRSTSEMARSALFFGNSDAINFMAALVTASEGELHSFGLANRIAGEIGHFVLSENKDNKGSVVILLDAVDSGLSADKILELKKDLFGTIMDEKLRPNKDITIYIVISANTFTMVKGEPAIDVQTGKEVFFEHYDDFESFIVNSRKVREEIDDKRTDWKKDDDEDEDEEVMDEEEPEEEEEEDDDDAYEITEEDRAEIQKEVERRLKEMAEEEARKSKQNEEIQNYLNKDPFASYYDTPSGGEGGRQSYVVHTDANGDVQIKYL